jgi:hypothetical protein
LKEDIVRGRAGAEKIWDGAAAILDAETQKIRGDGILERRVVHGDRGQTGVDALGKQEQYKNR